MANWFMRMFERKVSAFGPMTVRMSLGQPVWPDRSMEKLALEGYRRNVIAYRCVRYTAELAASVPRCLFDGDKEIETHPLLDLLAKPNPVQDGIAFQEAWLSHLQISGNDFIERVDGVQGLPKELYVLPPDRMTVVPGPQGLPAAYEYSVGGTKRRVDVDYERGIVPILHGRLFHPLNDWYGLSPLDPAGWAVDTHSSAGAFSKAILDNSAVPSGALVVNADKEGDATLSQEQSEHLKSELKTRFSGSKNAGRPMVLEGNLSWQQFGMTHLDMQLIEMQREAARQIALAYGVPPMILGIPGDNTYSNYQEANSALWKQTIIPLAERAARAISNWLCPAYGPGFRLELDLDGIDALADDREKAWSRIDRATDLTVNERRDAKGYERVEGGDVISVSSASIPLEAAGEDVAGGPEPDDDEAA